MNKLIQDFLKKGKTFMYLSLFNFVWLLIDIIILITMDLHGIGLILLLALPFGFSLFKFVAMIRTGMKDYIFKDRTAVSASDMYISKNLYGAWYIFFIVVPAEMFCLGGFAFLYLFDKSVIDRTGIKKLLTIEISVTKKVIDFANDEIKKAVSIKVFAYLFTLVSTGLAAIIFAFDVVSYIQIIFVSLTFGSTLYGSYILVRVSTIGIRTIGYINPGIIKSTGEYKRMLNSNVMNRFSILGIIYSDLLLLPEKNVKSNTTAPLAFATGVGVSMWLGFILSPIILIEFIGDKAEFKLDKGKTSMYLLFAIYFGSTLFMFTYGLMYMDDSNNLNVLAGIGGALFFSWIFIFDQIDKHYKRTIFKKLNNLK